MNLNLSFLIFGIFISLSEGTSTIQVPSAGNCGDDTVLTCLVSGNIGFTGWYGINRDLVANGVAVRSEDNNKYTDSKGTSSFTLTIHNTNITDGGDYKCRNGFDESQLKRLNIECKASSASSSVTRGKKVQITVDKLYPVSPRLTATFKRQKSAIQISGSSACSSSTQYTGYYRCVWTSSNSLDDGSYTYSIVVTTITQASPLTGSFKIASPSTPLISNVVQFNASREVVYGNEGQSLTIQCTSTGGYPSPTVTWYKNGISSSNQLSYTSSGTLQSDGTYTVNLQHTFTPAMSDDRKYLICRSYYPQADSAKVGSISKSVLLYLRLKPSQPTVTQTSVVPAGSTVTVRCTTSGCRPAASISWLYQGMTFSGSTTNTADAATETFTVFSTYTRQVTASDNGQSIQCIVTHPALVSPAQLTRSTNLTVQYIPAVPMLLYYFGRYTGVDMFIFHGGSNGGSLQTFVIETRINGTNVWTEQLRFNETDVRYLQHKQMLYRFDIKGLLPGVYNVRVLVGNSVGWIPTELAPMIEFTVYQLEEEQSQQQQSDHKAAIVGGSLSFVIVGILVAGVFIFRKMTCKNAEKKSSENTVSSTYDSLHTQPEAGTTYSTLTIETGSKRVPQDKMYENLQTQSAHDTSQML